MKAARIDEIERYITANRSVSLEELCEKFGISKSTVRRDIDTLASAGKVRKVYGGVCAPDPGQTHMPLLPFEERSVRNHEEKLAICRKAASMVVPGDVIFIDTGTTCIHMVEYLADTPCTVITNSLNVALKALPHENITLITAPGRLNRKTWSFAGHDAGEYLSTLNIQKSFMAATGLTVKSGLTNASEDEYTVKKNVCCSSSQIYLLADHDKFGKAALYTYCQLKDITGIVTDCPPPDEFEVYCRAEGIELIY